MKKRSYRAVEVKDVERARLAEAVKERRVVVGVDAAKEEYFGALTLEDRQVLTTVKWKQPAQTRELVELLRSLPASRVEVAIEPSGSYGDPLRWQLQQAGIPVYRVSPKRCHDAAEVYDGVPSMHDRKAASVVAKLHLDGATEPWRERPEAERELRAAVAQMAGWDEQYHRLTNRIEAMLATHWPELPFILDLGSVTLLAVLEHFGSPQAVWAGREPASKVMQRVGRAFLKAEKIRQVIESARATTGVPMIEAEREQLMELAREASRCRQAAERARSWVEHLSTRHESTCAASKVVGRATAAALTVSVGDPLRFHCAAAYVKAMGLNLKERSSGKHKGQLKITKRGPGVARWYLYLAVLRLVQTDEVARAWYARKVKRDGGQHKGKAIVALMRKVAAALWHVARGPTFDSRLLFDVRRLALTAA